MIALVWAAPSTVYVKAADLPSLKLTFAVRPIAPQWQRFGVQRRAGAESRAGLWSTKFLDTPDSIGKWPPARRRFLVLVSCFALRLRGCK